MKSIINVSLVIVLILSTIVFAAKGKKAVGEPKKPAQDTVSAEPNKQADINSTVVVTVNGSPITEGQVDSILNPRMEQLVDRIPENLVPQYRQQLRKRIIDQLIIEELLAQKEKQKNIDVNQAELDQRINKLVSRQNLTIDEFKALLKAYGSNYNDYQQNMRKRLMFEKLMDSELAGKVVEPTEDEMKAYYNENIQQFSEPEKVHAKHILIKPQEDINDPEAAKAKAKLQAQELLKRIKDGESFEELAKQYSACPSSKDGGDLGMQPKGTFIPEFEKAAFALKAGQLSDIVQTNFGYHIIKVVEHTEANTASFEQVKDQIKAALSDKQKEQLVVNYIQKIKSEADIKYADEADKLEPQIPESQQTSTHKETEKGQTEEKK